MEILVTARYLVHESRLKFYEVIEFCNIDANLHLVARRWGKITDIARGGGWTKVMTFEDVRLCRDAARKIVVEKERRGYMPRAAIFGLHGESNGIDSAVIRSVIDRHYSGDTDAASMIAMGIGADVYLKADLFDGFDDDVIEETPGPKPESVRSAEWSSW